MTDVKCIDESEQAYNDVRQSRHESSFGHEALAGAASFGAFKIFEDRQRSEGMSINCFVFPYLNIMNYSAQNQSIILGFGVWMFLKLSDVNIYGASKGKFCSRPINNICL